MNLKHLKKQSGEFILMVGDSGSGKSSAANTYPGSTFNFDFDRRIKGILAYAPLKKKVERGDIAYEYFMRDKTYEDVATKLDIICNKAKDKRSDFDIIVLSSLTSLEDFMIADAWKFTSTTTKEGGDKVRVYGEIKLPGYDQWGYEQVAFSEIIQTLKLISTYGITCIVDAHWVTSYDQLGKPDGKEIAIRPKLAKNILKDFDEIYFFEKKFVGGRDKGRVKHIVTFRNELARTAYAHFPNQFDWTDLDFYESLHGGTDADDERDK